MFEIKNMNQALLDQKNFPKLSQEVINLVKDFPNYYIPCNKIWISGEPICKWEKKSINPAITDEQKRIIEEKITDELLRERYKKYGLCQECGQPNSSGHDYEVSWCQFCNTKHFQEEFAKNEWTSNNKAIDSFIKDYQQIAISSIEAIEWIPWDKLKVEKNSLGKGSFGKVYKTEWSDGYIIDWNIKEKKWNRFKETFFLDNDFVVVKVFKDSRNSPQVIKDMLDEVGYYIMLRNTLTERIVKCFGITQDPETGDYAILLIHTGETLNSYIKKNNSLDFEKKNGNI